MVIQNCLLLNCGVFRYFAVRYCGVIVLEQLSKPFFKRFYGVRKSRAAKKWAQFSNSGKNYVFVSCSYISFALEHLSIKVASNRKMIFWRVLTPLKAVYHCPHPFRWAYFCSALHTMQQRTITSMIIVSEISAFSKNHGIQIVCWKKVVCTQVSYFIVIPESPAGPRLCNEEKL